MAWEFSDALKIGGVIGAVSTSFAVNRNKIMVLFKKTDRHQETLFGKDKDGGLVSDVKVVNEKLDNMDEKFDDQKEDLKWIRNHLQNGGKK